MTRWTRTWVLAGGRCAREVMDDLGGCAHGGDIEIRQYDGARLSVTIAPASELVGEKPRGQVWRCLECGAHQLD